MSPLKQQLEHAIVFGDQRELEALLQANPDLLNTQFESNLGLTPLMWACRNRRDGMVEYLLGLGADVNLIDYHEPSGDGGNTALWLTAQGEMEGTVGIARMLLKAGADVDAVGEYGMTPLFMAASWVHLDLVQFLVSKGAAPQRQNARGQTILKMLQQDQVQISEVEKPNPAYRKFLERVPRVIDYLKSV